MTGTVHRLQQLMCGLRGHEAVLCFERHRLSLRCLSCGYQTTGWALEATAVIRNGSHAISFPAGSLL